MQTNVHNQLKVRTEQLRSPPDNDSVGREVLRCKMFNGRNTSKKWKFNLLLFILVNTENTLLDVVFASIPLEYKNPDTCMGVSVIFLSHG